MNEFILLIYLHGNYYYIMNNTNSLLQGKGQRQETGLRQNHIHDSLPHLQNSFAQLKLSTTIMSEVGNDHMHGHRQSTLDCRYLTLLCDHLKK
jgi:hypothetical protein